MMKDKNYDERAAVSEQYREPTPVAVGHTSIKLHCGQQLFLMGLQLANIFPFNFEYL